MKPSDIKVGEIYRNRGSGTTLRRVGKIGKDIAATWYGSGSPPDEPVVEFVAFRMVHGEWEPQYVGTLYLSAFAAWAREVA